MGRKLMIRVRWTPLVIGLLVGAVVVVWSAVRSFQKVWVRPAEAIAVPLDARLRGAHAHRWWMTIRVFEGVMDSLRQDSVGVHRYDSIVSRRPGLMDSLRRAEEFFYLEEQLNK